MLAGDAALRAELAELAALQDGVSGMMARADINSTDVSRREAVVRRVSRALTAARLEPLRTESAPGESARRRLLIAWWAYPIAIAAALLVGIMLLSDNRPMNLPAPPAQTIRRCGGLIPAPGDRADFPGRSGEGTDQPEQRGERTCLVPERRTWIDNPMRDRMKSIRLAACAVVLATPLVLFAEQGGPRPISRQGGGGPSHSTTGRTDGGFARRRSRRTQQRRHGVVPREYGEILQGTRPQTLGSDGRR